MLVYFHKEFTLEGETTVAKEKKHFWSQTHYKRQKIYLNTGVEGYCDESEVEAEVERLTQKCFEQDGWGRDFTGWERIVPYDELLKIAEELEWGTIDHLPKNELTTKTLENWTVLHAANTLTAEKFGKFYRDYVETPTRWSVLNEYYPETCTDYRKVVKGRWVPWAGGLVGCSVCGYEYTDYLECKNFCGNCGADMGEDNNGDTKD